MIFIPKFESLAEVIDFTEEWFTAPREGAPPISQQYLDAARSNQRKFPKDLDGLEEMSSDHSQELGFVGEHLPDAMLLLQAALAFATMDVAKEFAASQSERKPLLGESAKKVIVEDRVKYIQRVVNALERLASTIKHRSISINTNISAEKDRFRSENRRPSNQP